MIHKASELQVCYSRKNRFDTKDRTKNNLAPNQHSKSSFTNSSLKNQKSKDKP